MAIGSQFQLAPFSVTPSPPPTGFLSLYVEGTTVYLQDSLGNVYAFGSTSAIASLTGDVTAVGPGAAVATVQFVGGESAANVASATAEVLSATSVATPSTLVIRDSSGNASFNILTAALTGNVTGNLTGNVTGNVSGSSSSFTGSLAGDVTGTQSATSIAASIVTAKLLTGLLAGTNTPIAATDSILTAFEKLQAQINAIGGSDVTAVTASSPLQSSGGATPNISFLNQAAASFLAGPATGAAASPTFRSILSTDLPNLSSIYVPQSEVGAANGVASLDANGFVPLSETNPSLITPFYLEYHVNPGYAGATQIGSYNQPFTTIQAAVNAAQAYGAANAVVFLHGNGTTENVTINNYSFNLLICNYGSTAIDNQTFVLNGNITISGLSTRIRLKDFKIQYPGGTQPDLIDSSSGRNYFSNVGFEGGGGIQYTSSWASWHEYTDCTISGPVSIAGTPAAGSTISMWRTRGGANYTVNSSNASLALYDNFSIGNVTQAAGNLTIDGGRGFTSGSVISSTTNSGSDLLTIINVSLETSGSSFAQINKTGTCPYILSNVFRNEVSDVLTGSRLVQGASAADEKYVPTTPSNWPVVPNSVLQALDELATSGAALPFVGDTGAGGTQGLVPAPGAGTKAAGDFLKADGTWAYVDQSKPIYPPFSQVGQTPFTVGINAKFENIATYTGIDGNKQYAAVVAGGGVATLVIYDITNPAIPIMCSYAVLAGAYNVAVAQISGAIYAFVPSSGGSTLYIRNITNPYSIVATSSILISGSPGSLYDCVYANGYVYIATQNKGLTVVDVGGGLAGGTITAPIQSYQEGGTTNKSAGIAISGSIVYTTNYQTTFPATVRYLKTWELAAGGGTLAVPFLANTYTIPGGPTPTSTKPSGVTISQSGTTAFVTDGNQGVVNIIDVTTPTSPNYITYITPSYSLVTNTLEEVANAVSTNGNYLYVPSGANATNGGCIDLFDISTLSAPIKLRSVYSGVPNAVFGCMALNNGYIFVADYQTTATYSSLDVFTQASLSPTFGLPVTSNIQVQQLTPNTAVVSSGSNQLASSATTATELGYVHGVTSPIQPQINTLVADATILTNYIDKTSMQFAWNYLLPHYYTQMIYTGSYVTEIIYWDSPSMTTQVFTKNMTYTGGLVTQIVLTRISDSATLTKTITYSGTQVSTVTRT